MEEDLPQATIGELQDELLEVIETGKPVDYEQVRKVNTMLNELRSILADAETEPDHEELDFEMVSEVRRAIASVLIHPGENGEAQD